jgi:hypothetical protein
MNRKEQIKVKMKQIEHSADKPHYTEKEKEEEEEEEERDFD